MRKRYIVVLVTFLITVNFFSAVGKNQTYVDTYDGKPLSESYDTYGYGYRLYDPEGRYDPGPVRFKLDEPEKVYPLAYNNRTITGGCYNSSAYTWYVCDVTGNIWTIDMWSGATTLIFGTGEGLSALASDPQTGEMYGAYNDVLYGIDMQSGEILWEWDIADGSLGPIVGMAADGYDHLYVVDLFDTLYRLDLETFNVTSIGPLLITIEGTADLEFDVNTGILYLSASTNQGELYKVNTAHGEATLIGVFDAGARVSGFIIPWNWPPPPPESPQITGPNNGKINVEYEYTFVSTDPEGDDLTYIINWSDGTIGEHGVYPSGEPILVKHAWSEQGTYIIKAKARNVHGVESDWGTFEVTMPSNKGLFNALFVKRCEKFLSYRTHLKIDILTEKRICPEKSYFNATILVTNRGVTPFENLNLSVSFLQILPGPRIPNDYYTRADNVVLEPGGSYQCNFSCKPWIEADRLALFLLEAYVSYDVWVLKYKIRFFLIYDPLSSDERI